MTESSAGPRSRQATPEPIGRLWLVATLAVLLSEIVVFLPYIAHERSHLADRPYRGRLDRRARRRRRATMDTAKRDELLRLSRAPRRSG